MIKKRNYPVSIFIPVSILSDVSSLIEKTFKVGQIARAASIFRIDNIVVYSDNPRSKDDSFLIRDLLSYVETPQYLRKRLFPLSDSLKYAGMLPPLRTPHHPLESTATAFREGYVLRSSSIGSVVDIGLRHPIESTARLTVNSRITMKLSGGSWMPAAKDEIPYYWGYATRVEFKPLKQILAAGLYDSIIATSRIGEQLPSVYVKLKSILANAKHLAILFGSPQAGLHEILAKEGARIEDFADLIINVAPNQGTATIRTEEAVMITLSIINSADALYASDSHATQ